MGGLAREMRPRAGGPQRGSPQPAGGWGWAFAYTKPGSLHPFPLSIPLGHTKGVLEETWVGSGNGGNKVAWQKAARLGHRAPGAMAGLRGSLPRACPSPPPVLAAGPIHMATRGGPGPFLRFFCQNHQIITKNKSDRTESRKPMGRVSALRQGRARFGVERTKAE